MQLYSRAVSPFSARVRVSIAAKALPIRIVDDPAVQSAEYGQLSPLRRVPVLQLDDGTAIPESDTIVEFLEDRFPETPLRPVAPEARARVRLITRVAELYVFPACLPIFGAHASGDHASLAGLFEGLDHALGNLARVLEEGESWHAWGPRLTTADGALAAFLFYAQVVGQLGRREPLARFARLQRFWHGAQSQPVLSTVIQEMGAGLAGARAKAGA
ncbi:MAG: glutathione S-transferase family protein [Polyangiales bacterium]